MYNYINLYYHLLLMGMRPAPAGGGTQNLSYEPKMKYLQPA